MTISQTYGATRVPLGLGEDGVEISWQPLRAPNLLVVGVDPHQRAVRLVRIGTSLEEQGWQVHTDTPPEQEPPPRLGRTRRPDHRDLDDARELPSDTELVFRFLRTRIEALTSGEPQTFTPPLALVVDHEHPFAAARRYGTPAGQTMYMLRGIANFGHAVNLHLVLGASCSGLKLLKAELLERFQGRMILNAPDPEVYEIRDDYGNARPARLSNGSDCARPVAKVHIATSG